MIEVMMKHAVRNVAYLPRERRRAGHVHQIVRVKKIGLHQGIQGIEQSYTISFKPVLVVVRFEWSGGDASGTLVILLHGESLRRTFQPQRDRLEVRTCDPESHAPVGVNRWGYQLGRLLGIFRKRCGNKRQDERRSKESSTS